MAAESRKQGACLTVYEFLNMTLMAITENRWWQPALDFSAFLLEQISAFPKTNQDGVSSETLKKSKTKNVYL